MLTVNESIVVGSEAILSLYPILVKSIPAGIPTQIFSRLLTFVGAGGAAASKEDIVSTWGSAAGIKRSLFVGLITVIHIYVSYLAFSSLSAGVSMSLFYTYPIWNLLIAKSVFKEDISPESWLPLALGVLGTFLLSTKGIADEVRGLTVNSAGAAVGVVAAIAAALTESMMYFAVKTTKTQSPWSAILELYGGALAWMLPAIATGLVSIQYSLKAWKPLVLFNLTVGFLGYAARFYAIPNVKTEVFGLLSYAGVISAFLFGFFFFGEKPSLWSLIGAALIAYAASYLEKVKSAAESKGASQQPAPPDASH